MSINNIIIVIIFVIVFGGSLIFINICMVKNFKRDKDYFFLVNLIIADIVYLSVYLPAVIFAVASLL